MPGASPDRDSAARGLLLLCDHASNEIPPGYGTLGLSRTDLARHIAYDIGAAEVTRLLAARLGAPAVLSRFSRLFIDPNRGVDDPTLLMKLSDGAVVPGNRTADATEVARRMSLAYAPYHDAIDAAIDSAGSGKTATHPPTLLSIHSFTPAWKRAPRPWHITVLWDDDPRFARPLLAALQHEADLCVDENEPYSGRLDGDCMHRHGTKRGLPHALIEIRQDLIANADGQASWADRLARILETLWADPDVLTQLTTPRPVAVVDGC
ncbi:MAG: N-formylglutamate amidohydrolase [Pseudomonadota bacterium]